MARPKLQFENAPGGLGRLPDSEDHISAIIIGLTASPVAWTAPIGKKYASTAEAEADLIISSSPAYGMLHYFISEFFAIAGASTLYVINSNSENYNSKAFFDYTEGKVRQAFVYSESNYAALPAKVGELKGFANEMEALHAPLIILSNVKDEATILDGAAQPDLRTLNADGIAIINFGDGSGSGKALASSLGLKYIPAGGAVLGCYSKANVHESVAWINKFNLARGAEMQTIIFSDGTSVSLASESILDTLDAKGFWFATKQIGIAGTYIVDTHACNSAISDVAYIENTRTIQKAKRVIRAALLPDLNSPLEVNDEGKLAAITVQYFKNKTDRPLQLMENAGELSGFSSTIDPAQNVLATSKLFIGVELQPKGVARQMTFSLGFTTSL